MKRKITTIDQFGLHVYGPNKDGRIRAWDPETGRVCQYCRLLMEKILGRRLERGEDVHHIDENPNNNDPSNLEIIDHREHCKQHGIKEEHKYQEESRECKYCKKIFTLTERQIAKIESVKRTGRGNNVGIFCSHYCSRHWQMENQKPTE